MSAFIVSKLHIDVMIWAADHYYPERYGPFSWYWLGSRKKLRVDMNADEVGTMLWAENRASVAHRYREDAEQEAYVYQKPARLRPYSHVEVLKAIECYEYQSCEHEEVWEASEARAYCDSLRRAVIASLPGYAEAPWGILGEMGVGVEKAPEGSEPGKETSF